jgi:hypothetical protein
MARRAETLLLVTTLGLWLATSSWADDELEDVLEDFDAELPSEPAPAWEDGGEEERWWRVSGLLDLETAFNVDQNRTEYEGVAKLRLEGRLQLDVELPLAWKLRAGGRGWYDFAYLTQGRSEFPDSVLRAYESEGEVWESWIGGPVGPVDFRLGRQITTFGTSENLRVVDVVFPIDNREPAAADLEDLYLPELHARIDLPLRGWDLTGIAILERRFSEMPPAGSSFLPPGLPSPPIDRPSNALSNTEVVLAARTHWGAADVGLLGAYFFRDLPSSRLNLSTPGGIERTHDRLWMVGGTVAGAWRDFILRAELAGLGGFTFAADPGEKHTRLDALAGVEYFGFPDVVNRWYPGAPSAIERAPDFTPVDVTELAFRARYGLLRERLHLTFVALSFGVRAELGAVFRLQADYALSDALRLTGGVLLYRSGEDLPLSALGRNDRIFVGLSYRY